MLVIAATLVGYALGCAVPGYYLVRWRTGRDIRTVGSGKVGATNVRRVLGRGWMLATVAGDIGKGALAVAIARLLDLDTVSTAVVACAVTAGHVWPAQIGFRGGRGAATAFGAVLLLAPAAALGAFVIAALGAKLTGRVTAAGIAGIAAAPPLASVFGGPSDALAVGALAGIVLLAHRDHLVTIARGLGRPHEPHPAAERATVAPARDGGA